MGMSNGLGTPTKHIDGMGEIKPFRIYLSAMEIAIGCNPLFSSSSDVNSKRKDLLMIVEKYDDSSLTADSFIRYMTHFYLGNLNVLTENKLSSRYEFGIGPVLEFNIEHTGLKSIRYVARFCSTGKATTDLQKIHAPSYSLISKLYEKAPDVMDLFGVQKAEGFILPNHKFVEKSKED
jgi:hypothetical protein